jgi:hypothetical protein
LNILQSQECLSLHFDLPRRIFTRTRIRIRIIFESWNRIWIRIRVKRGIRIRITNKIKKLFKLKLEPWTLMMEAQIVAVDLHHFDDEQDPYPDPH